MIMHYNGLTKAPYPAPGHLYWRVRFNGSVDGTYVSFSELQFRSTVGTPTQNTGGTASASTIYSATYSAAMAFDNNTNTWFNTAAGDVNGWIKYQFPVEYNVKQVAITSMWAANNALQAPAGIYIEYSDNDTTWTTAATYLGLAQWGTTETRTFLVPNP